MGKKGLKIVGIIFFLLIVAAIAAPFILEAKIGDILRKNVNENINGTFDFSDANLSLIKTFPNAEISLENAVLINETPFKGDTLFAAQNLEMTMPLGELFKDEDEFISITNVLLEQATIHVQVNEDEIASYEIGKESETETSTDDADGFTLDLQSYEITNSEVIYDDRAAAIHLVVSDIQHTGTGDLSATTSELDTKTEALVSFELDSTNYLNKNKIKLDALIGIDLEQDKYTFLKNEAIVNQLPLVFDGFVKVNEDSQDVDIHFVTPSSDFKNFLALIPEEYSKNIEHVQTTGNFVVEGNFDGRSDDEHIPEFNIKINSEDASFKYPDLPKSVHNVKIDTKIINTTGIVEDTYVDIDKLSFMIDNDQFNLIAKAEDLLGNTKVNAHVDALMNLANIKKAYPVPADLDLKGFIDADITTAFDMVSVENERYENTKTNGVMKLSNFEYASDEFNNPVLIDDAKVTFGTKNVILNSLGVKTGNTDFSASGSIDNFLGFMFNDENIEGNFKLFSETFDVNDFMTEEVAEKSEKNESDEKISLEEQIKIPSFLDAYMAVNAKNVIYDNITLKDVNGGLTIKDEKASLSNMSSDLFNGKVNFDGQVSTKNEVPSFNIKLDMTSLKIAETFKSLELFDALAPIASILRGTLDTEIVISGKLNNDFTPDLTTISGDVVAHILQSDIDPKKAEFLNKIGKKLEFLKPENLNLKGLKTALSFEEGKVRVKPFTVKYKDIEVYVDGSHTFDKKLNYKATMQVPFKYLGSEVNNLISKIDDSSLDNLTIPVIATIGGNYKSPEVSTDLTGGIKDLTNKLVEIQKQKLINKGKNKAKDVLNDVLEGNSTNQDSTKTKDQSKEAVKDVLGGILGGTKKDTSQIETEVIKDTVVSKTPEEDLKDSAKDILGGLFGRKKKKDSVIKDSVQ